MAEQWIVSADFIADYLTTFFPSNEDTVNETDQQAEIKSAVSYITNDLLENAMKFNDETSPYPISIGLYLYSDKLVFVVTNTLLPQAVEKFQAFIKQIPISNLEELYIKQLERSGDKSDRESGLGLLTMMNNYLAKIGWKVESVYQEPEIISVTTMLQLII